MRIMTSILAASMLAAAGTANAAIIVDLSPDAIGATAPFNASNTTTGQNFLMQFTLASATNLTGIDIYSECCGALGDGATVKIRTDAGGVPSNVNAYSIATTISAVDSVGATTAGTANSRRHADFAATLAAGTYWIGLSGDTELGWTAYGGFNNFPSQYQLGDDAIQFSPTVGRFAYRLYDDAGTVPEPATWGLLLAGFTAVGIATRRRRALAA